MDQETTSGAALDSASQTLSHAASVNSAESSEYMTRGNIAFIGVRVVGLYAIIQAFPYFFNFFEYLVDHDGTKDIGYKFRGLIIGASGVVLIAKAEKLAHWLLPRTNVVAIEPPGHGPAQLQAIAFSIVGLLLFIWSAPSLLWFLIEYLISNSEASQYSALARMKQSIPMLAYYSVRTAMGVWLFCGSKGLSTWWWSLRHSEFHPTLPSEADATTAAPEDTGDH